MTIIAGRFASEPHEVALGGPPTLTDQDGAGEPYTPAQAVCGGIWTDQPTDSRSPINPSPKGTTR